MDERRSRGRHEVWFPVQLDGEALKERVAMSHDVSSGGVLLSARTNLEPGSHVTVSFKILPGGEGETHTLTGRVVRVEPNRDDPDGLWPLRVAVEFDHAVPELEALLAEAEAERRKNWG